MFKTLYSRRNKKFLAALRAAREDRKISQEALARKLRVGQSMVSKVERGERRLDVVELEIWCRALGTNLNEFLATF